MRVESGIKGEYDKALEFIGRDSLHEPAHVFMVMSPDISVMTQRLVRGRGLIGPASGH